MIDLITIKDEPEVEKHKGGHRMNAGRPPSGKPPSKQLGIRLPHHLAIYVQEFGNSTKFIISLIEEHKKKNS